MISLTPWKDQILDTISEKASMCYLITILSLVAGMPFPPVTFFAAIGIYSSYRNSDLFVQWHATQSLIIQLFMFIFNTITFVWIFLLFFSDLQISNTFFGFLFSTTILNIIVLIATIYTASKVRKGIHCEWILFGPITQWLIDKQHNKINV